MRSSLAEGRGEYKQYGDWREPSKLQCGVTFD
jgi:hypothetical protein